ncbi:MAG: hypothetical protein U1F41_12900 [Burkholderiales bacterium]
MRVQPGALGRWLHRLLTVGSIVLVVASLVVLHRFVRELDAADVGAALRALDPAAIAFAATMVAGAYFTLTFYDYFALRTLRFRLPYHVAAMGGFASYAIGHSIGATSVAAATIRYRVYAPYGLDALAVAKVCLIAGMTFWLGNAAFLGLGMASHPQAAAAVSHLPESLNRAIGVVLLAAIGLYLGWVGRRGRSVGYRDAELRLPGRKLTLLQIAIGMADLTFCALAMHALVPDPGVPFAAFAIVFISAMLLGFASNTPGGLGVFDAAMLLGLSHVPAATVASALVAYRILYYLVPLALAVMLLVVREIVLALRQTSSEP